MITDETREGINGHPLPKPPGPPGPPSNQPDLGGVDLTQDTVEHPVDAPENTNNTGNGQNTHKEGPLVSDSAAYEALKVEHAKLSLSFNKMEGDLSNARQKIVGLENRLGTGEIRSRNDFLFY